MYQELRVRNLHSKDTTWIRFDLKTAQHSLQSEETVV